MRDEREKLESEEKGDVPVDFKRILIGALFLAAILIAVKIFL